MKTTAKTCNSCRPVRVNTVLCHEHNCPTAWKDDKPGTKKIAAHGHSFVPVR